MDSLDPCLLDSFFDATDESLPSVTDCPDEDGEEELEWLADCDAFPTLDSFLPVRPAAAPPKLSVLAGGLPRVPGRARSKRRRRRNSPVCFPASAPPATGRRRCHHCQAEQTPQWRAGPMGPKTLCNACGVRFKSGRLVPEYRPATSPTFSTGLHSNSHRKIMEMRRLKQKGKG